MDLKGTGTVWAWSGGNRHVEEPMSWGLKGGTMYQNAS